MNPDKSSWYLKKVKTKRYLVILKASFFRNISMRDLSELFIRGGRKNECAKIRRSSGNTNTRANPNICFFMLSLVATSCKEVQSLGGTDDGEYSIKLSDSSIVSVYCDQTTDGGGWTVIQRRQSPYLVSFNRGWVEYQGGFGNVSSDFWLGNHNIHLLSHPTPVKIRFELEASGGQQGFAEYENFTVSGNSDNYRINLSGYSGNLGNSFFSSYIWWTENNMQFSTPDKDNDANPVGRCTDNSGWWYNYCGLINLNNPSHPHWNNWYQSSVIRSEMKIR